MNILLLKIICFIGLLSLTEQKRGSSDKTNLLSLGKNRSLLEALLQTVGRDIVASQKSTNHEYLASKGHHHHTSKHDHRTEDDHKNLMNIQTLNLVYKHNNNLRSKAKKAVARTQEQTEIEQLLDALQPLDDDEDALRCGCKKKNWGIDGDERCGCGGRGLQDLRTFDADHLVKWLAHHGTKYKLNDDVNAVVVDLSELQKYPVNRHLRHEEDVDKEIERVIERVKNEVRLKGNQDDLRNQDRFDDDDMQFGERCEGDRCNRLELDDLNEERCEGDRCGRLDDDEDRQPLRASDLKAILNLLKQVKPAGYQRRDDSGQSRGMPVLLDLDSLSSPTFDIPKDLFDEPKLNFNSKKQYYKKLLTPKERGRLARLMKELDLDRHRKEIDAKEIPTFVFRKENTEEPIIKKKLTLLPRPMKLKSKSAISSKHQNFRRSHPQDNYGLPFNLEVRGLGQAIY